MNTNGSELIAEHIYEQLKARNERLVLAESCTGGGVAAMLAQIPGISEYFCGSMVTYRPHCKRKWLGIKQNLIEVHTAESPKVVCEMASAILKICDEATWSASVVGHFDPNAAHNNIFVAIARRTKNGKIKCRKAVSHTIRDTLNRSEKHVEAIEVVLTIISRAILRQDMKKIKGRHKCNEK